MTANAHDPRAGIEAFRNPEDPLAAIERQTIADQLQSQRDVLELEDYVLRRLMFQQPALNVVTLAGGATQVPSLAESTIPGDERDVFNGVYVENPGFAPIAIGFNAGGAQGAGGYIVPSNSWKLIPVRFVNLSVGLVDPSLVSGPTIRVTVARLRVPPIGTSSGPLTGVPFLGIDDTIVLGGATAPSPGANASIVGLTGIPAGLYNVQLTTYQSTAPDAQATNIKLQANVRTVTSSLPSTSVPLTTNMRVRVDPNTNPVLQLLALNVNNAGGAGSVYVGIIAATRVA